MNRPTRYTVVLLKVGYPFADQVLDMDRYHNEQLARIVARSWSELDEVKSGRCRVKLIPVK